jgi:hypothetical protein
MCSTNHFQCSCTSLNCLKCVRRISLTKLNPNLHNIANNYIIQFSEAEADSTASAGPKHANEASKVLYKPFAMQLYVSELPKMCSSN